MSSTTVTPPAVEPESDKPTRAAVYDALHAFIQAGMPAPTNLTVGRNGDTTMWFDPEKIEDVDRWAKWWQVRPTLGREYPGADGVTYRTYRASARAGGWRIDLNCTVRAARLGAA